MVVHAISCLLIKMFRGLEIVTMVLCYEFLSITVQHLYIHGVLLSSEDQIGFQL